MVISNVTTAQPGEKFIDCSSTLTSAVVKAAMADGVKGFMKYVPYGTKDKSKFLHAAERDAVLSAGGWLMINWEIERDRSLQGFAVGKSDGARSRDACRKLGYPEDVSAPCAVDMDTLAANFNVVHDFCRGHWGACGDKSPTYGYLDTDGGRALADICQGIWIPGAFAWSPELHELKKKLKLRNDLTKTQKQQLIVAEAAKNPQAMAIQTPSTVAYGISVDFNYVLKPITVWCAPRTVKENTMSIAVFESQTNPKEFNAVFFAEVDSDGRSIELQWSGDGADPRVQARIAVMDATFGPRRPLLLAGVRNNRLHPKHQPSDILDNAKAGGWADNDFAP